MHLVGFFIALLPHLYHCWSRIKFFDCSFILTFANISTLNAEKQLVVNNYILRIQKSIHNKQLYRVSVLISSGAVAFSDLLTQEPQTAKFHLFWPRGKMSDFRCMESLIDVLIKKS
jgi:hypothetical protein